MVKKTGIETVACNPRTGSVLCLGKRIEAAAVAQQGEAEGLFALSLSEAQQGPLSHTLGRAFKKVDNEINRFTTGELDLPSIAFLTLLGIGVYQLMRGNVAVPPWYTALWYAFGVFSKTLADGFQEKVG